MTDTFDFQIKRSWLPTLGEAAGNLTTLSPFRHGTAEGDPRGEMVQSGVMDMEGRIQPDFQDTVQALAAPKRVSRLRFVSPEMSFEYQAFFDGEARVPVALFSTEEGYIVRSPADPEEPVRMIAEVSGVSPQAGVQFTLSLPAADARVALALTDAVRQHAAMVVAAEVEPVIPVVSVDDLLPRLQPESIHPNRLESAYRNLGVDDQAMDAGAVSASLASLAGQGLVQQVEGGFTAAGSLLDIAEGVLLLHGIYQFDTVLEDAGGLVGAGRGVVVTGGPRTVLLFEHDQGTIHLSGISGEAFMGIVLPLFMRDPPEGTLPEPQPAAPPAAAPAAPPAEAEVAAAGPKFCGKCGGALQPGVKFCGSCGNPVG